MLARPHPVLGWLHCQPEDRRLLDRQLAHRDHALKADPSFTGMPASFVEETWVNWLPKAVAKPFYRDQLTAHIAELERQIPISAGRLNGSRRPARSTRCSCRSQTTSQASAGDLINLVNQPIPGTTTTDAEHS